MRKGQSEPVPAYTEQAMGYVWEKAVVRWVVVYRGVRGEACWHDGMAQDTLPEGLFALMESLWDKLPTGYAYLLDLEERQVDVLPMTVLDAFVQDVGPGEGFDVWYMEDEDVRRVCQMLIAYGERLVRRAAHQACRACYLGYQWQAAGRQFVPCVWCNPTGD